MPKVNVENELSPVEFHVISNPRKFACVLCDRFAARISGVHPHFEHNQFGTCFRLWGIGEY